MTDEHAGPVTYDFDWNPEKAKSNLVGNMPSTNAKLSKRLGHQGMEIIPYTKGGTS
jgi:hypothetical protein